MYPLRHTSPTSTAYASLCAHGETARLTPPATRPHAPPVQTEHTSYTGKIATPLNIHTKSPWREHLVCDTRAPCAQGPQSPQKEFDSTLGYPGEGPIVPKLVVATFNVQGLKMDTTDSDHYQPKLKKLLHWAKQHNIDAICIQEHNCGTNEFNRLRNGCNAFGYCLIMARRDRVAVPM